MDSDVHALDDDDDDDDDNTIVGPLPVMERLRSVGHCDSKR